MKSEVKNRKVVKDGIAFTGKNWSYVLRIPDSKTGKTKPKWVGGYPTKKAAQTARDVARVALAMNNYAAPGKMKLGEFLDSWIELHSRNLKPITEHKYRQLIRLYLRPLLGSINIHELRPSHIESFYSHMLSNPGRNGQILSPRTAKQCGAILKKALKYAVEVEGLIAFNAATRVPLPKSRSKAPNPWSIEELKEFLMAASAHRQFFFFG